MLSIYKKRSFPSKGFTLIESLISMSIVAVIGTVTISILFMTLRAGKKSDVLIGLKQNGNTAMSQIIKNIRYAKSLDSPSSCLTPVTVPRITLSSVVDSGQTSFICTTGSLPTIASNGASLIDTNIATVAGCSFTCTQPTLNDPPTISIFFKLNSRNTTNVVETIGNVPFQTSVTMRNYNR